MDKTEVHCALCSILLEPIQFNLINDNSKYSNTTLISIIENVAGKFLTPHFDICIQCYDLLNELDAIMLRQMEIRNRFKKYIEHHSKQYISNIAKETPKNINTIANEINDIKQPYCNEKVENNITTESDAKFDLNAEDATFTMCSVKEEIESAPNEKETERPITKKNGKRKKHPNDPIPHKCHCLKQFRTAGELKNHMNTHSNNRAFICEICGQSYKHKAAFNIHMNMHNGINPFTCIYCNKSFTQKGALVRHVPLHTGEMPHQCEECGKRFIHHTSFNIHRLSHTGRKSYKCTACGLALMSGSHLKRHMRIHTGEKKFACGTCGKRFAERYNLAVHEKLHTNPCSSIRQKRNYSCQICGESFERKVMLDAHSVKQHQVIRSELDNKDILKQQLIVSNNRVPTSCYMDICRDKK